MPVAATGADPSSEASTRRQASYRRYCAIEPSIPLFMRDWWLDRVCGPAGWRANFIQRDGRMVAAMPVPLRTRWGFRLVTQPPLTPTLGPWIRAAAEGGDRHPPAQSNELLGQLIDQLPAFDHLTINCTPAMTDWLPFHWKGFSQTTRYTSILPDLSDEAVLWSRLHDHRRRDILRAMRRSRLTIRDDLPVSDLVRLHAMTFVRQGRQSPVPERLIVALDEECRKRNCRALLVAQDPQGRRHAAAYIVWDDRCAYYLLGGVDPVLRSSDAGSLCLWEAIRRASAVTRSFDFEGSMIEGIGRFFRGFGTVQTPYFQLSRTPSRLMRLRTCMDYLRRER